MQTTLPVNLVKPRFLQEVPRSEFSSAPVLKEGSDKSRRSFISLLRKGPSNKETQTAGTPKQIEFNCAAWLNCNTELNQTVSLMLHVKDSKEEYLLLVDESNPCGGNSVMLSGCVTVRPKGQIEFIRACCSGVNNEQHIQIEELHVKGSTNVQNMKLVANA